MPILQYILALLRAILLFGLMALYILVYGISCIFLKHTKQRALKLRKHFIGNVAIPCLHLKIIVQGRPSVSPAIYVSNHRSFIDPVAICNYLDAFVIAKAEVANYPIINKGAELTGVIWVKREDKQSRSATRESMITTLNEGFNILVFPEGTVSISETIIPYRKGTFIEAYEHDYPIVPIVIEYQSKKDMWLIPNLMKQYFHQFGKWKTEIKLVFGNPIFGTSGDDIHATVETWTVETLKSLQYNWKEN